MQDIDGYYTDIEITVDGDSILEHICGDPEETLRQMRQYLGQTDFEDAVHEVMRGREGDGLTTEEEVLEKVKAREFESDVEVNLLGALLPRLFERFDDVAKFSAYRTRLALATRLSNMVSSLMYESQSEIEELKKMVEEMRSEGGDDGTAS